jgi:hypothetical protein
MNKVKKKSRRIKINFDTVNKGKQTPIPAEAIAESRERIIEEIRKKSKKCKHKFLGPTWMYDICSKCGEMF